MKGKTILYVISSAGTTDKSGKGGHFRSLHTIASEMSKSENVFIIYFGIFLSPVFKDNKNVVHISLKKPFFLIKKELNKIILEKSIDIIHAFDEFSYAISLLNSYVKSIVLTKCGGINIQKYPYTKVLTLFSKENYDFYSNIKQYKNSNIHLIANRVTSFNCDISLINDINNIINKKENDIVILRIARLHPFYENSIFQTINLYNYFKNNFKDKSFKLLIIGEVYDSKTINEINLKINDDSNVTLLSDERFVKDAKKIIDIADVVVGAGRSLMEAAYCGKIIFAANSGNQLPTLMNENTFEILFRYNFSSRIPYNTVNSYNVEDTFLYCDELKNFSKKVFNDYFSINKGIEKYLKIYNSMLMHYNFIELIRLKKDMILFLIHLRLLMIYYFIKRI